MTWELKLTRVALIKIIQLLWPCSVSKAKKKLMNSTSGMVHNVTFIMNYLDYELATDHQSLPTCHIPATLCDGGP